MPTAYMAWMMGTTVRLTAAWTSPASMFMVAPHSPLPAASSTRPKVASGSRPRSAPTPALTIPTAQTPTPTRPDARAPIRVTIGPEVGRVMREPREAISSIVPIVAGVSPRSSRTSGRRDSQAEVPKPRQT